MRGDFETQSKDLLPYLDEIYNPEINTIILSKCSIDSNFIYRARVISKSMDNNEILLDCFDYADHFRIKLDKSRNQWILENDSKITFELFKYPLHLMQFPIVTFGLKIQSIPSKRIMNDSVSKKLEDFFTEISPFQIHEIIEAEMLEVSIKNDEMLNIQTLLHGKLEGPYAIFKNKILEKGNHHAILIQNIQDLIWCMTAVDFEVMNTSIETLKLAYDLADTFSLLDDFKPKLHELCFLYEPDCGYLTRYIIYLVF